MSVSQTGEVGELISQAERALASGDRARADALLLRVKAVDPEHPAILNETALRELRSGNAAAARELLERAVARDGSNTRLLMNLAGTLRRLGLADDEMRIIERVLAVEPRHLFALLQKATLLESQGKHACRCEGVSQRAADHSAGHERSRRAARADRQGDRSNQGERCSARRVSGRAAAGIARRATPARSRIASTTASTASSAVAGSSRRSRRSCISRSCRRASSIRARSFHGSSSSKPRRADIREEFERVFAEDAASLEPYVAYPQGVPLDQWAELNHSRRWSVFYLWRDGKPVEDHLQRCPRTAQLLTTLPLLRHRRLRADRLLLDPRREVAHSCAYRRHQHARHRARAAHRSAGLPLPRRLDDARVAARRSLGVRRLDRARSVERQRRAARDSHPRCLESVPERGRARSGERNGDGHRAVLRRLIAARSRSTDACTLQLDVRCRRRQLCLALASHTRPRMRCRRRCGPAPT